MAAGRPPGWARRSGAARAAAAALAVALGAALPARPATFGVAGAGDPAGYFVLVGWDAVDPGLARALGDITHEVILHVEVTGGPLRVLLYDPGLLGSDPRLPARQLDLNLSPRGETSSMRYTLLDPGGRVLAQATYGADTTQTDHALVDFYDSLRDPPRGPLPAGLYRLEAALLDGPGLEEDVSVFGVSVPGYDVWTLDLTAGSVEDGGATIAEPLRIHPWIASAQAGDDGGSPPRPVCGLSFVNYDLDAAASGAPPPAVGLVTRRGYAFPAGRFPPSADAEFWITRNTGIPWGPLDADDHGIWTWEFSGLGQVLETTGGTPRGLNAFMAQVLDFDIVARHFENFPVRPPDDADGPRRLYLPRDDGRAPLKESLGHAAVVVAGPDPPTVGQTSTLEVTVRLEDPTGYPLAAVAGSTFVSPAAELADPLLVGAGGGLAATVSALDPRRIDFTGSVAPGAAGTVTYRVDVTPSSPSLFWITGDGGDYTGGARPTRVVYDTPFTAGETFGPVCMLPLEARSPVCLPDPVVSATPGAVCAGDAVTLDARSSSIQDCSGTPELQWREDGAVVAPFPAPATLVRNPTRDALYTLDLRCSTLPATCIASRDATVLVRPLPAAAIDPPSPVFCAGGSVELAAAGGPPYVWSTAPPGLPGDGSTAATVTATAAGRYTVSVTDGNGCTGAASADVAEVPDVVPGPLGNVLRAVREGTDDVRLAWTDGTDPAGAYHPLHLDCDTDADGVCDVFPVRASLDPAPFAGVAPGVETWLDALGVRRASFLVWYRVRAASPCTLQPGEP